MIRFRSIAEPKEEGTRWAFCASSEVPTSHQLVSQKQSKKQRRISWNSFFRTRLLFSSPSVPSLRIPTSLYYCDEMGPSPLYPHYRRDFHAVAAPRSISFLCSLFVSSPREGRLRSIGREDKQRAVGRERWQTCGSPFRPARPPMGRVVPLR